MVSLAPFVVLCALTALALASTAAKHHSCCLTASIAVEPFSSLDATSLLASISSSVELKKNGQSICKASPDMETPIVNTTKTQKICAAAGLSLNLLAFNAPATFIGATLAEVVLKMATHLEIVDDFTENHWNVTLSAPKLKCAVTFPKPECTYLYRAEFDCPSELQKRGIVSNTDKRSLIISLESNTSSLSFASLLKALLSLIFPKIDRSLLTECLAWHTVYTSYVLHNTPSFLEQSH